MATGTAALSTSKTSPDASPATKPLDASTTTSPNPNADMPNAKNVTSPGELCGYVDTLLNTLEQRFDDMSEQVLGRMNDMAQRIDNLETAISDLMAGGEPVSPSPPPKRV